MINILLYSNGMCSLYFYMSLQKWLHSRKPEPLQGILKMKLVDEVKFIDCDPHWYAYKVIVSFDLQSLFANVPIDAAVEAALQKRENKPTLADPYKLSPAQIVDLLNFLLRSTYFQYNRSILWTTGRCSHGKTGFRCYC